MIVIFALLLYTQVPVVVRVTKYVFGALERSVIFPVEGSRVSPTGVEENIPDELPTSTGTGSVVPLTQYVPDE